MSAATFVGIDLGSSYFKAVALAPDGTARAIARRPTPWETNDGPVHLKPGRVQELCSELVAEVAGPTPNDPVCVGVASMGETGVALDAAGTPVGNAVAWFDRSALSELPDLEAGLGAEKFALLTGTPLDHTRSIAKYRWGRRNVPAYAEAVHWCNLAEFAASSLAGGLVTNERTLLSRTGFVLLSTGEPWPDALAAAGAPLTLVDAGQRAPAARGSALLGRGAVAMAVAGGHDHPVAAYALSGRGPGVTVVTCGTTMTVVTPIELVPDSAALRRVIAAGLTIGPAAGAEGSRYVLQGGNMDGLELSKVREALVDEVGEPDWPRVDAEAAEVLAVRSKALRSAELDPRSGAPALWARSVLAVWERLGELESITAEVCASAGRVVSGRWSSSVAFRKAAEVTAGERPVRFAALTEAGCLGAALLARQRWREAL